MVPWRPLRSAFSLLLLLPPALLPGLAAASKDTASPPSTARSRPPPALPGFVAPRPAAAAAATATSPPRGRSHFAAPPPPSAVSDPRDVGALDDAVDSEATAAADRRYVLSGVLSAPVLAAVAVLLPTTSGAEGSTPPAPAPYVRSGSGFAYTITPPPGFVPTNKPLKTHLDEVNFAREGSRGYQYGITVDPVRIASLRQFGSPEEVAARVVTAEVNRDGVFEVTLAGDAEELEGGGYAIDYVSDGKRGKKRFVTRTFIKDQRLYVLAAQVKEEEYAGRAEEIARCVGTFRPL